MEHLGAVHPASRIDASFIFRSSIATVAEWPCRAIPEMFLSLPSGSFFLCYPRTGIPTGTRMRNSTDSSRRPTSSPTTSFNCTADPPLAHPQSPKAVAAKYAQHHHSISFIISMKAPKRTLAEGDITIQTTTTRPGSG